MEVSTNWAIENGPFRVALSALTTRMSTGDGSPEVNCQVMVLLVFCTLRSDILSTFHVCCNIEMHIPVTCTTRLIDSKRTCWDAPTSVVREIR